MVPRTATVVDGAWSVDVEDPGGDEAETIGELVALMSTPTPEAAKAQ